MKGVFPMKRRFAAVAAAVLLCAVPALAQDKLPPLRTGVDGTFAPHAMPKLGGGVEGFQIDLFTEVAKRLKQSCREYDYVARMGGDEFVVVMPGHDMAGAAVVANRLVGVLAQPVYAEGREMPSSVSIGVAAAPQHGTSSSELLRHANAALYRAKATGRNRVVAA